jgi:hypothetical protein
MIELEVLLARVEHDQRQQRADDDVHADQQQQQPLAARSAEIRRRIPEQQHRGDDGHGDRSADREMDRCSLPARDAVQPHGPIALD